MKRHFETLLLRNQPKVLMKVTHLKDNAAFFLMWDTSFFFFSFFCEKNNSSYRCRPFIIDYAAPSYGRRSIILLKRMGGVAALSYKDWGKLMRGRDGVSYTMQGPRTCCPCWEDCTGFVLAQNILCGMKYTQFNIRTKTYTHYKSTATIKWILLSSTTVGWWLRSVSPR